MRYAKFGNTDMVVSEIALGTWGIGGAGWDDNSEDKVRLFVQNRSRKYRQKVTVTTLFQTAFHRIFQLLPQTAHICFHRRKWVHTRLSEKDRTQRPTRRNRGLPSPGHSTVLSCW